jgi:hypothetical protein
MKRLAAAKARRRLQPDPFKEPVDPFEDEEDESEEQYPLPAGLLAAAGIESDEDEDNLLNEE